MALSVHNTRDSPQVPLEASRYEVALAFVERRVPARSFQGRTSPRTPTFPAVTGVRVTERASPRRISEPPVPPTEGHVQPYVHHPSHARSRCSVLEPATRSAICGDPFLDVCSFSPFETPSGGDVDCMILPGHAGGWRASWATATSPGRSAPRAGGGITLHRGSRGHRHS